ncbi:chorismate-binding protein [Millisia brevis]|uniref:chorismate-binding protein n=1 Tax=Millisia brevis TaxID=264148 RepID=UPI00083319A9|nr:chorismate-binding protein [Millisia brevis]
MSTTTLLIDNYDSFTYNLFDLLCAVDGVEPDVVVNDAQLSDEQLRRYARIVISPGPGRPDRDGDIGLGRRAIASGVPILGVCLGHQALITELGGTVERMDRPWHGLIDTIVHDRDGLFAGLPEPLTVVRYHSLAAVEVPDELRVTARGSDGTVMAVEHRSRPLWGVQFHPESICSVGGRELLANFRRLAERHPATRSGPGGSIGDPAARPVGRAERGSLTESRATSVAAPVTPRRPHRLICRRIDHHPEAEAVLDALFSGTRATFWLDRVHAAVGERFSIVGDAGGPFGYVLRYGVDSGADVIVDDGVRRLDGPLLPILRAELAALPDLAPDVDVPFDFRLGFVGSLGYDLAAEIGPPGYADHAAPPPGLEEPHRPAHPHDRCDAELVFAGRALVIDHEGRRCYLLALSNADTDAAVEDWLSTAQRAIATTPAAEPVATAGRLPAVDPHDLIGVLRDPPARYLDVIDRCMEQIRAGESYEICLTTAIEWTSSLDPAALFRRLRRRIAVPYAGFLRIDDLRVVGLSPERYLRVDRAGTVESRPIKGTRPRGAGRRSDAAARLDLQTSVKDRAENLMIVDLVRNDLGRVCRPGSVEVPDLFTIESFAPVHQMISTIRGTLRADRDGLDAIAASFPPGSMTGAPKARTMAILDTVESGRRGLYSGAMGYLTRGAVLDLAVVIRTLVSRGDRHSAGAGSAVTALSDPGEELRETLVKASTFRQAVPCERLPSGATEACENGMLGETAASATDSAADATIATCPNDDGV